MSYPILSQAHVTSVHQQGSYVIGTTLRVVPAQHLKGFLAEHPITYSLAREGTAVPKMVLFAQQSNCR